MSGQDEENSRIKGGSDAFPQPVPPEKGKGEGVSQEEIEAYVFDVLGIKKVSTGRDPLP